MFSCDTTKADCDYKNQYCVDHSYYSRETIIDENGEQISAKSERDDDPLTIADNLVCAGYPVFELPNHDGARVNRRQLQIERRKKFSQLI